MARAGPRGGGDQRGGRPGLAVPAHGPCAAAAALRRQRALARRSRGRARTGQGRGARGCQVLLGLGSLSCRRFHSRRPSQAPAWPGRVHVPVGPGLALRAPGMPHSRRGLCRGQGARSPAGRTAGAVAAAAAAAAAARPGQGDRGQGRAAALDPAVRAGPAELRRRGRRGAAARVCGGTPP